MASVGRRGLCAPPRQHHTSALQRHRPPRCSVDKNGKHIKLKMNFRDLKEENWEAPIMSWFESKRMSWSFFKYFFSVLRIQIFAVTEHRRQKTALLRQNLQEQRLDFHPDFGQTDQWNCSESCPVPSLEWWQSVDWILLTALQGTKKSKKKKRERKEKRGNSWRV